MSTREDRDSRGLPGGTLLPGSRAPRLPGSPPHHSPPGTVPGSAAAQTPCQPYTSTLQRVLSWTSLILLAPCVCPFGSPQKQPSKGHQPRGSICPRPRPRAEESNILLHLYPICGTNFPPPPRLVEQENLIQPEEKGQKSRSCPLFPPSLCKLQIVTQPL